MWTRVAHASTHLVRRSLGENDPDDAAQKWMLILSEVPNWGWAVITLTLILIPIAMILIDYTLNLVFVLAAVEDHDQSYNMDPTAPGPKNSRRMGGGSSYSSVATKPPAYKDIDNPPAGASDPLMEEDPAEPVDPELFGLPQKPITTSIRRTIRHLHAVGGFRGRWRGFWCIFFWAMAIGILNNIFSSIFWASVIFTPTITRVVLANWEMAWVHIVTTQPSHLRWYRRFQGWKSWKKIWLPTLLNDVILLAAQGAPVLLFFGLNYHKKFNEGEPLTPGDGGKLLGLCIFLVITYFAISVPAGVALIRCQASMVSPEEEPIVPFDRTFGGRVVSEAQGGSGCLKFGEAWTSLTRKAISRIYWLVIKTFVINVALNAVLFSALGLELLFIVMPAIRRAHDEGMLQLPSADYAAAQAGGN